MRIMRWKGDAESTENLPASTASSARASAILTFSVSMAFPLSRASSYACERATKVALQSLVSVSMSAIVEQILPVPTTTIYSMIMSPSTRVSWRVLCPRLVERQYRYCRKDDRSRPRSACPAARQNALLDFRAGPQARRFQGHSASHIERLERRGAIAGYSVRLSQDYEENLGCAHIFIIAFSKVTAAV